MSTLIRLFLFASLIIVSAKYNKGICQNRVYVDVSVKDKDNTELEGVYIRLSITSTNIVETKTTNEYGELTFSIPEKEIKEGNDNARFELKKDGYLDKIIENVNLSTMRANNSQKFQIQKVGKDSVIIVFRIHDNKDRQDRIPDARVTLRLPRTDLNPTEKVTDENGRVQFVLPIKEIRQQDIAIIEIEKEGYEVAKEDIRISEKNADNYQTFSLKKKNEALSYNHNSLDYIPIAGHFKNKKPLIGLVYGVLTIGGLGYAIYANNEISDLNRLLEQSSSPTNQQEFESSIETWQMRRNLGLGLASASIVTSLIHNIIRVSNDKNSPLSTKLNFRKKNIGTLVFHPSHHPKLSISF